MKAMKISSLLELAILIIVSIVPAPSVLSTTHVTISIYYETLCPFSIRFIKDKFYPHYKDLKDYIHLELIPYGKANQTRISGEWFFQCQHGVDECKANKYQVCVFDQGRGQDKNVEFLKCMFSLSYPAHTPAIRYCARFHQFDWNNIEECFNNGRGDNLLAYMGRRTHNLKPKLTHVPRVIYNHNFDELLSTFAVEDFFKATCSQFKDEKPSVC